MKRIRFDRKRKSAAAAASMREQRDMLCDRLSFTAAESYKQLRANLLFALPDENKCRIVGVTSSIRGEGKSTTSVNTAYTLAETGKRTLLIDADMRLPSVAKKLAIAGKPGLSNLLAGMCTLSEAVHASPFMDNWQIMPAGDPPQSLGAAGLGADGEHAAGAGQGLRLHRGGPAAGGYRVRRPGHLPVGQRNHRGGPLRLYGPALPQRVHAPAGGC